MNVVYAQVGAYQDEPLALPGAEDDGQEDNSDAGIQISYHLQR